MSLEVNVVGTLCGAERGGLSCRYCYESSSSRGLQPPAIDLPAVKAAIDQAKPGKEGFSLFGGEPLLAPVAVLEDLWTFGLKRCGKNGVQTSGRPIRGQHFDLFRKYRVCVGFSIDGPGELNDARRAGTLERTRAATAHSVACLERCLKERIAATLIVTLSRANASPERLPRFLGWLSELDRLGLSAGGLHLMQHTPGAARFALSPQENLAALLAIRRHETHELKNVRFSLFRDVMAVLRGHDTWKWRDGTSAGVGCLWCGCDPMTTPAVQGVEPDGSSSLCLRLRSGPASWGKGPPGPQVRSLVLRATPQEDGGCRGCRQIITCKGQCPGTAIDGDWRKRSRDCETWRGLLEHFEETLLAAGERPVTLRPDRDKIEERMAGWWAAGRAARMETVLKGGGPGRGLRGPDYRDYTDYRDHDDLRPVVDGLAGGERV